MATPQRVMPVLPADVWRIVFSVFKKDHDLAHLWTECRNVSKLFTDEVEHVFKTKHLPKTSIAFDLGSIYCISDDAEEDEDNIFSSKNHVDLGGILFDLDRFAHNERIAIYKLRDGCVAKDLVCKVFERLPFAIPTPSTPNISRRQHLINIRRAVNDTDLPSLAFDEEKEELSFDWRGMYTHFYAEEKMFEKNQEYWLAQVKPYDERVRARIESRETDFMDNFHDQLELIWDAMQKSWQLARRARVRRQWREYLRYVEVDDKDAEKLDETVTECIDEHEMAALWRLNAARCLLYWTELGLIVEAAAESDEDDEDGNDEDDEDDEDDDEMDDNHMNVTSIQNEEAGENSNPSNSNLA